MSLSTLFRRAHAEARSDRRLRITYRERFRPALRRAWRAREMQPVAPVQPKVPTQIERHVAEVIDRHLQRLAAACRAERVVHASQNLEGTSDKLRASLVQRGSTFVLQHHRGLPPRPG